MNHNPYKIHCHNIFTNGLNKLTEARSSNLKFEALVTLGID